MICVIAKQRIRLVWDSTALSAMKNKLERLTFTGRNSTDNPIEMDWQCLYLISKSDSRRAE